MNESFKFPPLDLMRVEIRLARLCWRQQPEDDIHIELSGHELSDELDFTALSYMGTAVFQ